MIKKSKRRESVVYVACICKLQNINKILFENPESTASLGRK
jgi:hypothetical protein